MTQILKLMNITENQGSRLYQLKFVCFLFSKLYTCVLRFFKWLNLIFWMFLKFNFMNILWRLQGKRSVEHHPEENHHGKTEVECKSKLGEECGASLLSVLINDVESCGVKNKLMKTLGEGVE